MQPFQKLNSVFPWSQLSPTVGRIDFGFDYENCPCGKRSVSHCAYRCGSGAGRKRRASRQLLRGSSRRLRLRLSENGAPLRKRGQNRLCVWSAPARTRHRLSTKDSSFSEAFFPSGFIPVQNRSFAAKSDGNVLLALKPGLPLRSVRTSTALVEPRFWRAETSIETLVHFCALPESLDSRLSRVGSTRADREPQLTSSQSLICALLMETIFVAFAIFFYL